MKPLHAVFAGSVSHARLGAVPHHFRYRLSMIGLDLDHLAQVFRGRWFWSVNHRNLAAFHRSDHLRGGTADLATALRDRVERETGRRPQGAIQLLTQPRYFGVCFNPISLYLCHDPQGQLQTVVAEVHNTPWGEQHVYVLSAPRAPRAPRAGTFSATFAKRLHVSPFMPMDLQYNLRLLRGGGRLLLTLESRQRDRLVFVARLALRERPLEARSLAFLLLGVPFMTTRILLAIHWEALRLWLKRAPFFAHPTGSTPS